MPSFNVQGWKLRVWYVVLDNKQTFSGLGTSNKTCQYQTFLVCVPLITALELTWVISCSSNPACSANAIPNSYRLVRVSSAKFTFYKSAYDACTGPATCQTLFKSRDSFNNSSIIMLATSVPRQKLRYSSLNSSNGSPFFKASYMIWKNPPPSP